MFLCVKCNFGNYMQRVIYIISFSLGCDPIKAYNNINSSHTRVRHQVQRHEPKRSASAPCSNVKTAPPNTADIKTPEAFEVYCFNPFIESE